MITDEEREDEIMNEIVSEIPSMTEAIRFCVRRAGLTDKQVYLELGMDAGHWSRIMTGQAHFPQDKYKQLMNICRNDIPLRWLAKTCGYEIKLSVSSLEQKLQQKEEEVAALTNKLNTVLDVIKSLGKTDQEAKA